MHVGLIIEVLGGLFLLLLSIASASMKWQVGSIGEEPAKFVIIIVVRGGAQFAGAISG